MRLAIAAGFFAAIGLFAFGPASAAHATVESPEPSLSIVTEEPSGTDEPSEEVSTTEMFCDITGETTDDITIEFEPPETFEYLTITIEGEDVEFEEEAENAIVLQRPDTDVQALLNAWDEGDQQLASCPVTLPGVSQTPEPTESESTDESISTAAPTPTDQSPSSSPPPTTPDPSPTETSAPTPSLSPNTVTPTQPGSPTITPSTPAAPQPPTASPTPAPYAPPPAPSPSSPATTSSPTTTSPSEDRNAADAEQRGPREIRPLAESPRYLLPEIFGMQSHRGSPLVMPGPRDADDQASELETLPPISEDELDAITAQLSSPGHADRSSAGNQTENAAPQEPDSGQNSWWLLGGLTSSVGIGAVLWWALHRYRRNH